MSLYVDIKKQLEAYRLELQFESASKRLGILGESGAGKSMTLKCIAGIETPDSGQIILDTTTVYDREKDRPQAAGEKHRLSVSELCPVSDDERGKKYRRRP